MENIAIIRENKDNFTSLELVDWINKFREQEGKKKELLHKSFLNVIRDEFEEEIHEQKILPKHQSIAISNGATRQSLYYELNLKQSRQVLVRKTTGERKRKRKIKNC